MSRITFQDRLTRRTVNESTAFTVVAYFWNDATETWTAETPTTVRYRIDSPSSYEILAWTTGTPGTSLSIAVPATSSDIINDCAQMETKILTVQCNADLSTQYQDTYTWQVRNLAGQT